MFGNCCCEADLDFTEVIVAPIDDPWKQQSLHENGQLPQPVGDGTESYPFPVSSVGSSDSVRSQQSSRPSRGDRLKRLHSNLHKFRHAAVTGRPCMYFSEESGALVETQYKIQRAMDVLTIGPLRMPSGLTKSRRCRIDCIEHIHYYDASSPRTGARFPPQLLAILSNEQLQRLLVIEYMESGTLTRAYMIVDAVDDRGTFLECLKSLQIHAYGGDALLSHPHPLFGHA